MVSVRDAAAIVGLCALSIGCSMAWLPLGPIVFGALLLVAAVGAQLRDDGGGNNAAE